MFSLLTYQLLSVFFSLFTLLSFGQFNFKQIYFPNIPIHVKSYNNKINKWEHKTDEQKII